MTHLIAHLTYGKPTFDIASQMPCMICGNDPEVVDFIVPSREDCHECKGEGHWWITSAGHRVYPYWITEIADLTISEHPSRSCILDYVTDPPEDHPESFSYTISTKSEKLDAREKLRALGLLKAKPPSQLKIRRL